MTQWRTIFGCCCLLIASYFGYIGYLETRVNTPFDDNKVKKGIMTLGYNAYRLISISSDGTTNWLG